MMVIEMASSIPNSSLELKCLLARAKLINQYYEKDFDISFSSILLAFLVNNDVISQWFRYYVKKKEINIERLMEDRKVNNQILQDIALRIILPDQLSATYRQTTSTTIYLGIADKYRESLSRGDKTYPLQVHHLMASYIYDPWIHKKDLNRWGFDRVDWSNSFLVQIGKMYPPEFDFWNANELYFWRQQHIRVFLTSPDLSERSLHFRKAKTNVIHDDLFEAKHFQISG